MKRILYPILFLTFALACILSTDTLFVDEKGKHVKKDTPVKTRRAHIVSLPVVKQAPNSRTCGFHAASNAAVVNDLLTQNKALDKQNLSLRHETHFNELYQRMEGKTNHPGELNNIELGGALYKQGLTNAYALVKRNDYMVVNQAGKGQERIAFSSDQELNRLKSAILSQPINHFICNTGDHWVLLTRDNRTETPTYYFADSQANPGSSSHKLDPYVSFVESLA